MYYTVLMIFAALIGLLITVSAIFTVWVIWHHARSLKGDRQGNLVKMTGQYLLKWTLMDYAILILFLSGMLFLFTDLLAVMRDREFYPSYHYRYLLSGFVFSLLGMIFMYVRLGIVLRLFRSNDVLSSPKHHNEPPQADGTE